MEGPHVTEPTNSGPSGAGDNAAWLDYIDQLIKLHGISSSQFARDLGAAKSIVTHWRQGTRPGLDILRKIADVYRRPFAELLVASGWAQPDEVGLSSGGRRSVDVNDAELLRMVTARLRTLISEGEELTPDLAAAGEGKGSVMTARRTKTDSKVTTVRSRPAGRVSD